MPEAPAAPAGQPQVGSSDWIQKLIRTIAIFVAVQAGIKWFGSQFAGQQQQQATPAVQTTATTTGGPAPIVVDTKVAIPRWDSRPDPSEIQANYAPIPHLVAPIWDLDTSMDLSIYVSPSLVIPPLSKFPAGSKVLEEKHLVWNDWKDTREIEASFDVPTEVQHNATLWAHIFVAQSGSQMDPSAAGYDYAKAFHFVRPLTQYLPKKKARKARKLLSQGAEEVQKEEEVPAGVVTASYYHPNFTLSIVPDTGVITYAQLPGNIGEFIQLERSGARDITGNNGWYYPTFFLNTFWQLRTHMTELNNTVTRLPLNIHLNRQANWKFNVMSQMEYGMKQNAIKSAQGQSIPGGGDGSELEEVKRILLDSNPYLLATTVIVSIFHTIFELLAFKSDVSHWRKKKDNVGVSFRTILANVFMQTTIFLYLMDNNENTSWMILIGQGLGIVLEAWKITKTVDVRFRQTTPNTPFPLSLLPYTIVFEDKHKLSETEKKTQEYDAIAFYYLYRLAIPLLLAYAGYSLTYNDHKSWYSFVITTLVGSVYAYGFLMMVPSLYINYRLKSVAHMPGKAMMYKVLNTFIDDLFAFTIKMPILHRLATLRDDVIFFVYLYQSYKYKVDHTRVNEFGQGGDDDEEESKEELPEKLAAKPLTSPAGGEAKAMDKSGVAKIAGDGVAVKSSGRADGTATRRK